MSELTAPCTGSEGTARPWDRFLTDQDRALAARHRRAPYGIGAQPALLLIDLYRRAFGDRPQPVLEAIETSPSSCGTAAWDALPHIEHLIDVARRTAIPVIHVTGSAEMPGWRTPRGGSAPDRDELERWYELMPSVAPIENELVIRKAAPSAFFGTPLSALLRGSQVDSLIVAGESTSGCIRASVVDARSHRFRVTVAEECVFDRTEATHAINLFDMDQKYADVRGVADITEELLARG